MKLRSAVKSVSHLIPVVAVFGIVLSSGCIHLKGNDDYSDFIVSTETLRQIEPIELSEAGEEKKALIPDRDEPEPADLEISLEECRALTLENNLDLKVQLIGPAISAERVKEAEAGFEAAFSATAVYSETHSPVASEIELQGNQVDNTYTNLGVDIPLRTGGEIAINLIDNRVESNSEYMTPNPSYSSDFSASISQPLLRNAGKRANTHTIRIRNTAGRRMRPLQSFKLYTKSVMWIVPTGTCTPQESFWMFVSSRNNIPRPCLSRQSI